MGNAGLGRGVRAGSGQNEDVVDATVPLGMNEPPATALPSRASPAARGVAAPVKSFTSKR